MQIEFKNELAISKLFWSGRWYQQQYQYVKLLIPLPNDDDTEVDTVKEEETAVEVMEVLPVGLRKRVKYASNKFSDLQRIH